MPPYNCCFHALVYSPTVFPCNCCYYNLVYSLTVSPYNCCYHNFLYSLAVSHYNYCYHNLVYSLTVSPYSCFYDSTLITVICSCPECSIFSWTWHLNHLFYLSGRIQSDCIFPSAKLSVWRHRTHKQNYVLTF